jgi:hypothetical protein
MGKPIHYGSDENFFYNQDCHRIHFLDPDSSFLWIVSNEYSLDLFENERTRVRSEALEDLTDYIVGMAVDRELWTRRQWEILQLILMGKTQYEIATVLGIGQVSVNKTLLGNQIGNEKQGGITYKLINHLRSRAESDEALRDILERAEIKLPPGRIRRLLCDDTRAVYIETHGKVRAFHDHYRACDKLKIKPSHPTSIKIISRLEIGHTVICGKYRVSRSPDMSGEVSDISVQLSRNQVPCLYDGKMYSSLADAMRDAYPGIDDNAPLKSRVRNQVQKRGFHLLPNGKTIKRGVDGSTT